MMQFIDNWKLSYIDIYGMTARIPYIHHCRFGYALEGPRLIQCVKCRTEINIDDGLLFAIKLLLETEFD